ncbi:TauD/TfdA dioxygenase family protein [Streptomyces sp. NPDC060085]|uniref:TauD/TfdA dioxygenase family protein n=1 Tax=Streptomyces sp. NPDC060085 TaxID=3347054 RepID=UPI0036571875
MTKICQLSLAVGARVHGVDLATDMSESTWSEIRNAFQQHSVLVFPGQNITVEQQKRFAERFGTLIVHDHLLPMTIEGHPECMVLHNNAQKPPGLNSWHTDNSGWLEPPLGTVLYAKITPRLGGDTLYSNMHAAYEALSPQIRDMLEGLKAVHDVKKAFGPDFANLQASLRKKGIDPNSHFGQFEPVEHPIVRTHPDTGKKSLYVSAPYITHIAGLSVLESRAILDLLYKHIETNEFVYRHRWHTGDLVVWDNRSVQHLAVADYHPQERLMHRMNIKGERPF